MDEESDSDDDVLVHTKRKAKGKLGKLCTADTTIINQITWLHEVIYMCSGDPGVFKELDSMPFINGYITV